MIIGIWNTISTFLPTGGGYYLYIYQWSIWRTYFLSVFTYTNHLKYWFIWLEVSRITRRLWQTMQDEWTLLMVYLKKLRRWSCAFQGPIDYVMSLIYICCRILRTFHIIFRFCSVISPHNLFDRFLDPDYKTSIFFKEKINTYVLNNKRTNKKLMSKNNSLYHFWQDCITYLMRIEMKAARVSLLERIRYLAIQESWLDLPLKGNKGTN